jgi:RNA polymerase sigma factor (sigma-70 family)
MTPSDQRATFLSDPEILNWIRARVAGVVPRPAVDDVSQDVIVSVLRARRCPLEREEFLAWVHKVVRRRGADFLRGGNGRPSQMRRKRKETDAAPVVRYREVELPPDDGAALPGVTALDDHEARELLLKAQRALAEAAAHPTLQRDVTWLMRDLRGDSHAEIASESNVAVTTVEQALSRLRRRIRAAIGAASALALLLYFCLRTHSVPDHDKETAPPPPPPPTVVEPPPAPAPVSDARALRDRALAECAAHAWAPCQGDLDRARALDPDGEHDPRVVAARRDLAAALAAPSPSRSPSTPDREQPRR